ncbi:MAG: HD-GYP domain-containing protein [Deltaproteobacteria bacterium]|nr:HD-GYP domain-containing protein [Deltaproteobacteria bacterium]MBI3293608.1 HD-GYP domain-containing protein [Deltaproteobacteria bacterium]
MQFFEIRVNSVITNAPLDFDLFLTVGGKPVLFRKTGDVLTRERVKILFQHGGEKFLVPLDQRTLYLGSLKKAAHNPENSTEEKGKFLKETAFVHVNDLFTKKDISPVVTEAEGLVEEMVNFLTSDINATSSLMRLSVHDYYTYNHCVDVSVYSIVLARRIYGDSSKEVLMAAGLGGLLHDIGKRKVDWGIINKKSPLTTDEWKEVKRHPEYGREFLEEIPAIPDRTKLMVYEHHENFDGTGYPRGLREDQISGLARIVAIADVFDALTTDRSYHKAVNPKEAMDMMFGMQPGKFDPDIFQSFNKKIKKQTGMEFAPDFDPCQPGRVFK